MWKWPRAVGETTPCAHECVHHAAVLNPAIWSHLPKELLKLIFARLPLSDIFCLRYLSKEWNWNSNSKYSDFKRLCADAHPNVFGFISADLRIKTFLVRVCDKKSNAWHTFEMDSGIRPVVSFEQMQCASDGGLVCFLCRQRGNGGGRPIVFVCNPLTMEKKTLPSHSLPSWPIMLKLIMMDYERTYYQVIVVSADSPGRGSHPVVEIFESKTGRWTKSFESVEYYKDHILGYQYNREASALENEFTGKRLAPHIYDIEYEDLSESPVVSIRNQEATVTDWALVGRRLFVLYEKNEWLLERARYYISEFEWDTTNWIKLKDHAFSGLGNPPPSSKMYTSIYACQGFVFVGQHVHGSNSVRNCYQFQNRLNRLYDLSTGIWHALPPLSRGEEICHRDVMCELRWEVVP